MKLGRFKVAGEFYRDNKMMIAMQDGMAVLNVSMTMDSLDNYEFLATGEMFDEVTKGSIVPEYKVMFVPTCEGEFKFKRIES